MDNWKILAKFQIQNSKFKIFEFERMLLENRGIKTKKQREEFLNPDTTKITAKSVGINPGQLKKSLFRIKKAIKKKEKIIIFGDYDVDGICGSAILWETLRDLGANSLPYIPHRIEEGYGLSIKGIENLLSENPDTKLIITVDNGIVAGEAVDFANEKGLDVIITDHHLAAKIKPKAFSIIHSTKICGAAVAYILSKEILKSFKKALPDNHLELVALATVADLMPLKDFNRTFVKLGLKELNRTSRIGLLEIYKEAAIQKGKISAYEIGHIIAPRLNAMGRMEHAMDSLRLLCTTNMKRAADLAQKLGNTNRDRQKLTQDTLAHAKNLLTTKETRKLIFIYHESYQPGVIGLVAGRLTEEFYRPSIVISKGKVYSKASARSVRDFNIIEFIRFASSQLLDAGGHPGAAGFTVETSKLEILEKTLLNLSEKHIKDSQLVKTRYVDMELPFQFIDPKLYDVIEKLEPFGMGNPAPTFVARGVTVESVRAVGRENQYLKFALRFGKEPKNIIYGINFGLGEKFADFKKGDLIDIVYSIQEEEWEGRKTLSLRIKELKKNQ